MSLLEWVSRIRALCVTLLLITVSCSHPLQEDFGLAVGLSQQIGRVICLDGFQYRIRDIRARCLFLQGMYESRRINDQAWYTDSATELLIPISSIRMLFVTKGMLAHVCTDLRELDKSGKLLHESVAAPRCSHVPGWSSGQSRDPE